MAGDDGAAAPAGSGGTLSEPPLRMSYMYMPNGVRPDYWTPAGDGERLRDHART